MEFHGRDISPELAEKAKACKPPKSCLRWPRTKAKS